MSQQTTKDRSRDVAEAGRNLPVLHTGSSGTHARHAARTSRPFRSLAPFLAQLSLQYDDINVARRARKDRLETATRRYGRTAGDNPVRQEAARQDIHI